MRLAPKPLDIKERDGFKGTDLFGYKGFGEQLARLVESLEGPSVIALDGPWGSGKTVFARQWAGLLRRRGSAVIYFDAFATDSGEDPLADIASQLFAGAMGKTDEVTLQAFGDKTVRVIKSLAPTGVGVALGSVTGGVIGPGAVQAAAAAWSESGTASTNADEQVSIAFRRRIEGALERKEAISDFRKALESLAEAMKKEALGNADTADTTEKDKDPSLPRPLVVIIDELDRCKPTYALDLLEKIKHVFDANNVCFVLVTNAAQLEKVVESQYGVTDASAYLEKFFQERLVLPETKSQAKNDRYIQHLLEEMMGHQQLSLTHPVKMAISQIGVSMRGVERVALHFGWVLRVVSAGYPSRALFVMFVVCVVRALNADMYSRLRKGALSVEELAKFLHWDGWAMREERKKASTDILRSAFPPKEVVEKGPEAIKEWESDKGGLRDRVEDACRWLDVVQDPRPGPGR